MLRGGQLICKRLRLHTTADQIAAGLIGDRIGKPDVIEFPVHPVAEITQLAGQSRFDRMGVIDRADEFVVDIYAPALKQLDAGVLQQLICERTG